MAVCQKCSVETKNPESCWYCTDDLCVDCWEEWGHCGHYQAYEKNTKAHVKSLTQAQETIKKLEEQIEAGFMGGESSNLNVIETLGKRVDELEKVGNEIHDHIDLYVTWGDHYGETDASATVEKSFVLQNMLIKLKEALQE